jgi:hypothetical protein
VLLILDRDFCICRDQSRLGVMCMPRNFVEGAVGITWPFTLIRGEESGGLVFVWKLMSEDLDDWRASRLLKQ